MPAEQAVAATNTLLNQGVLGSVCVLLIAALIFLWRAKESAGKEYKKELKELMERHVAKAEEWAESGQKLAADLNKVLESISKGRV